jgi:hypothetical protein
MIGVRRDSMKSRQSWVVFVGALVWAVAGCAPVEAEDSSKLEFTADVVVSSDPGRPTPGVELVTASGGQKLGTTGENGSARMAFHGTEGESVDVTVKCPPGFQAPPSPISVSLRRLSVGSRVPSFAARCAPLTRTVVIGIRAENGPGLPVTYLGKEVGVTDPWGAAHVVLSVKPNEQVTLGLDTKAGATERRVKLRPESPTLTFVAKDKDDFVTLEQKFEIEKAPARPAGPTRGGPTRI